MARKKRRAAKKSGLTGKQIVAILIVIGFVLEVLLITTQGGVFGRSFKLNSYRLFGRGSLILLPMILLHGLFYLFSDHFDDRKRDMFYLYLLFLTALILLDFIENTGLSMRMRVRHGLEAAGEFKAAGVTGAALTYGLIKLFGRVGVYLWTLLAIFFSGSHFLKITPKQFFEELKRVGVWIGHLMMRAGAALGRMKRARQQKAKERRERDRKMFEQWEKQEDPILKEGRLDDESASFFPEIESEPVSARSFYPYPEDSDKKEASGESPKKTRRKTVHEERDEPAFNDYRQDDRDGEEIDAEKRRRAWREESEPTEKPLSGTQMEMANFEPEEKMYVFPPLDLLRHSETLPVEDKTHLMDKAKKIEQTLLNFGIESKVVMINRGPQVTCFELQPKPGIKVSRIVNLADDLSLALATSEIRIEAPIPGKPVVGIEVPNHQRDLVTLKDIIDTDIFREKNSRMPIALGKSISGRPVVSAINEMPHLLIAGATGSGKSVCINTIILSILYKSSPEEVKLILIDPKVVELSIYNEIPHLAIPVVTDPAKAANALAWAVREMERRYKVFSKDFVRDISSYNKKVDSLSAPERDAKEKLPFIVIIIDELCDLMMVASKDVEDSICRLAQKARACGIHLIVATQRPTVDVITGTIKANIPSRISFAVSSQIDSRTILDASGAETLLGKGDMLFCPAGGQKPERLQGAFVSDTEVEHIVSYIRDRNRCDYNKEMIQEIKKAQDITQSGTESEDRLFDDAVACVLQENQASISMLQRKLKIGYARAGRLIDEMEQQGIIGGHEGSKPRKILVGKDYFERRNEAEE